MTDDEKKIIPHLLSDSSKLREMSPSLFRGGLPYALAKLSRIVESHGAQARPPKMPGDAKMPEEYWQLQRQDAERKRLRKVADRKALAQEIAAALREQAPQTEPARVNESPAKPHTLTQEPAEHYPLPDPLNESWREDSDMELIERRMCAISWVIESKDFERMALEDGDKGRIKTVCEYSAPKLFKGSTVFSDAWKAGSKRQWWRMANWAKFMKHRAP